MTRAIEMPHTLWEEMMEVLNSRLKKGSLDKPIVFALYTKEDDHHEVIAYREIPTVKVRGKYPDDYTYTYPGIREKDFYPPKGTGKWFSGTLVVGDSTDLYEEDEKWMIRDKMYFRIKMDRDPLGQLSWKAYDIDFPIVAINSV